MVYPNLQAVAKYAERCSGQGQVSLLFSLCRKDCRLSCCCW